MKKLEVCALVFIWWRFKMIEAITSQEIQATIREMMSAEELQALEVRLTIKRALTMINYMEGGGYTAERQFEAESLKLLSSVLESKLTDESPFEWQLAALIAKGVAESRAVMLESAKDKVLGINIESLIGQDTSYEDYIDNQFVKKY